MIAVQVMVALMALEAAVAPPAQAPSEVPARAPSPPLPIVLELQTGWQGPLGDAALSLVFDRGGRLAAGVGVGFEQGIPNALPALGIFGRARLLRVGPVWLGASATFSRVHVEVDREYQRPPAGAYATDRLHWSWEPGYRASGALTAELAGARWSLRVESGAGYLLNQPRCSFDNGLLLSYGSCDDPDFPTAYRFAIQPGRVMPSVTASVGYRFGVGLPPTEKSPRTAVGVALLGTVVPLLAGAGIASTGDGSNQKFGLAAMAAGIVFGPSTGNVYTGEYERAAGLAVARGIGLAAGSYLLLSSTIRSSDCQGSECDTSLPGQLAAWALLVSVPVLAGYEIFDAPASARRANARSGVVDLGLLPTVATSGPAPGRGLTLAGRF
jgi:hypothetical protein